MCTLFQSHPAQATDTVHHWIICGNMETTISHRAGLDWIWVGWIRDLATPVRVHNKDTLPSLPGSRFVFISFEIKSKDLIIFQNHFKVNDNKWIFLWISSKCLSFKNILFMQKLCNDIGMYYNDCVHARMCVCVCVWVCKDACMRACKTESKHQSLRQST